MTRTRRLNGPRLSDGELEPMLHMRLGSSEHLIEDDEELELVSFPSDRAFSQSLDCTLDMTRVSPIFLS